MSSCLQTSRSVSKISFMWRQDSAGRGSPAGDLTHKKSTKDRRRRSRTTILLYAMALSYAVLFLPFTVLSALMDLNFVDMQSEFVHKVDAVFKILSIFSICVNPFLYGFLNTNFKREFKEIFGCLNCHWLTEAVRRLNGYRRGVSGFGGESGPRGGDLVCSPRAPTITTTITPRSPKAPLADEYSVLYQSTPKSRRQQGVPVRNLEAHLSERVPINSGQPRQLDKKTPTNGQHFAGDMAPPIVKLLNFDDDQL